MKPATRIICFVLFLALFASAAHAHHPTAKDLLANIPRLSPENEELKSFAFSLESPMFFGTPFTMVTQWKRDEPMRLLTTFGESNTPVCYMADGDAFVFDALQQRVMYIRDTYVKLVLFSDQKGFQFNYGFETKKEKATLKVDFAGLLQQALEDGEVSRTENGDWRIEFVSKSGRTKFEIDFMDDECYTLRQVTSRSVKENALAFTIRNFSYNKPSNFHWPAFPQTDALGDEVEILELDEDSIGFNPESLLTTMNFMIAQIGFAAIESDEMRDQKFFNSVDWEAAEQFAAKYSPRLKRLLRSPATVEIASEEPPSVR